MHYMQQHDIELIFTSHKDRSILKCKNKIIIIIEEKSVAG